jgi:hypothetical protein
MPEQKEKTKLEKEEEIVFKHFESGAQRTRDADHAAFHLLPFKSLELASMVLKKGGEKYGERNWEKGLPVDDTINHALQHLYKYLAGDTSEAHLSHALCNLLFVNHFEYEGQKALIENT